MPVDNNITIMQLLDNGIIIVLIFFSIVGGEGGMYIFLYNNPQFNMSLFEYL